MTSPAPLLESTGLRAGYGGRRPRVVLEDLNLRVEPGALTCLLGPNGSGKSTLLRTLAGMQPPLAGTLRLLGDDLAHLPALERARRLAVVLTDQLDVGILRAVDLVGLGRYPHTGLLGRLGPRDHRAVRWALDATGASALADRSVAELSDGERQRVLIARALAQQPAVLALDEPIAFIDVPRRVELTQLLRDLARECGLGVLLTTHDLDLALRVADTVWLLEPRAGEPSCLHVGAPEDLALSGAVQRAFGSGEVRFDLERAMFVPRPGALGRVRVVGTGPRAVWAARAMEREGLTVADDAPITVEATGAGAWVLRSAVETSTHTTVGGLALAVRTLLPRLATTEPQHP